MAQSSIAMTAGFMSLAVGLFIALIAVAMFIKYVERKKNSTMYLAISILIWFIAAWSVCIIYFFSGNNLPLAIICQKVVYIMTFFGTMFTFLFATEIFFKIKRIWKILYLLAGLIMILFIIFMDSVAVTEFPDHTGYPLLNIKLPFVILLVIYIVPTTIGIFYLALRTSRKIEERQYRIGFRVIALGEFMIFLTFISDTLQGIFIENIILYALFLYLTWVFPLAGCVFYYLGYIMPGWFMKWFKETEK
jgi:hypothetical protein